MRCKRCGEILNPGDTQCPVCGKTLTPTRKRPPARKPEENSVKLPQLDKFTRSYRQDTARSRNLQTLTIVAVAAVIVLLVLVYLSVVDLQSTVDQLRQDAQDVLQSQSTPSPAPTDPTELTEAATESPTDAQPLPLGQQDVEAALTLFYNGSGTYAAAEMDLDRVTTWVSTTGKPTDRQTGVAWVLEETGDRLELLLSDRSGAEGRYSASLTWSLTGETFGGYADPMCIWEYRLTGGEWESLPIENMTAVPDGCEMHLSAEELTALLGTAAGMELRCRVSMTHTAGGTLTITAGGIGLNTEGLTVSGDMPD